MTHHCLLLDDYLDGRLSDADAEAFEIHALDCDVCDEALALPDELSAGLRDLADCACPPAVIDAALRTARRAPDRRAAVATRRRRGFWAAPVSLVALAVALVVLLPPAPERESRPVVTDAPAPLSESTRVAVATPAPDVPPVLDTDEVHADEVDAADAAPVRTRRPADRTRRARPAPRADRPPTASAPTPSAQDQPTQAEIEAATQDLALAFRLVAEAQSEARDALRDEAGELSSTLDTALPF